MSSKLLLITAKIIRKVTVINIGTNTGHEETSTNIIIKIMINYARSGSIILEITIFHNFMAPQADIKARAISSKINLR